MKEQIEQIKLKSIEEIKNSTDLKNLEELRVKYLGKKGELTAVLRGMKDLSPEERPIIGNLVNEVKAELENLIEEKETLFKQEELNKKLEAEKIDITLPGRFTMKLIETQRSTRTAKMNIPRSDAPLVISFKIPPDMSLVISEPAL